MSVTSITDSRADRDILITENMGLVHTCAHRFTGKGIEYEDLFQAGCMGLVKAFDAFDRERGVRFSTYAVPVILGEIRRLFRDGGTVKVSRTLKELSIRTAREREKFALKEGREPTIKELAEQLGVSIMAGGLCRRAGNFADGRRRQRRRTGGCSGCFAGGTDCRAAFCNTGGFFSGGARQSHSPASVLRKQDPNANCGGAWDDSGAGFTQGKENTRPAAAGT